MIDHFVFTAIVLLSPHVCDSVEISERLSMERSGGGGSLNTVNTTVIGDNKSPSQYIGLKISDNKYKIDSGSVSSTNSLQSNNMSVLAAPADAKGNFRLSKFVTPTRYDLHLHPDLNTGLILGRVKISLDVASRTDKLVLHNKGLQITNASLLMCNEDGSKQVPIGKTFNIDSLEHFIVELNAPIAPGCYVLSLDYNGDMKHRIVGIYQSTYKGSSGENRKIATSKFEPTYARQAFPCFDEPAMKAIFTVELVRPKNGGYITLSNMDIKETDIEVEGSNDLVMDTFKESVPMSTYLSCFIVCDFKYEELEVNANGIGPNFPFRVYATDKQLKNVEFPLKVGVDVTEYYIKYFQLSYPLPKLDMIAIPDFVSGAMEHWGLVTFRETNLLYDVNTTSPANMQNIARVVAHEISHMWFGNLVTMNWWNELWLNEGFASYMQYKALNEIRPEWKSMEQFGYANTHSVLALDSTLNSHPIVQTVSTPDEITAIFDSISYNKGAAVLRMLEGFVGLEDFQKGVSAYLKKYQYKNTVTQNLLDELDEIFGPKNPGLNLTYIMDTWTRQMGYPVVEVVPKDATTFTLTQKRFLVNPDIQPGSPSEYNDRWFIPITYTTDKGAKSDIVWFSDKVDSIELKIPAGEKLLKLNNDQVGYYRVDYSPQMWKDITTELSKADTKLTNSDKAHILNDVFNLAEASEVGFDTAFDISLYLKEEKTYVPWAVASSSFSGLKRILSNSVGFLNYKTYVRGLLDAAYRSVTWEDKITDEHLTSLLRSVILSLACSMGNEDCLSQARDKFQAWLNAKTSGTLGEDINPNIKSVVYFYGIETTGEQQWSQLWDIYMKETDAQEKSKFQQALAASKDPAILQRYLTLAWEEDNVRGQDYFSVLQYIASNPVGTALVWDFWRDSWDQIVKRFSLNNRVLGTTVPAITRSFATQYKLDEMETFFAQNPDAGAGIAAREQAKDNIKNNISWLKKHEETVRNWLDNQLKP